MCVCSTIYGSIQKDFDHFICFWKWFLSLFVFIFSAYFVFHYFKHVLCWKTSVKFFCDSLTTRQSGNWKSAFFFFFLLFLQLTHDSWNSQVVCSSRSFRDSRKFSWPISWLTNRRTPRNSFLKDFHGKPVLNLSHPLLNPSFNIFTWKPNPFEWFFIPLTSLR